MKIKINDIKIFNRVRKDLGDLEPLLKSMQKHQLLNPVIVNSRGELIAGHRRVEAAKILGWTEIEVKVIDPQDRMEWLELEMDENIARKDFNFEEILEGLHLKQLYHSKNIFIKLWLWLKDLFKK